jgi:hypothetical protein
MESVYLQIVTVKDHLISEFSESSMCAHCPKCFQALSPMKVRCPEWGNFDRRRVGNAVADLLLGTTAFIGALGLVFLAVLEQV